MALGHITPHNPPPRLLFVGPSAVQRRGVCSVPLGYTAIYMRGPFLPATAWLFCCGTDQQTWGGRGLQRTIGVHISQALLCESCCQIRFLMTKVHEEVGGT